MIQEEEIQKLAEYVKVTPVY